LIVEQIAGRSFRPRPVNSLVDCQCASLVRLRRKVRARLGAHHTGIQKGINPLCSAENAEQSVEQLEWLEAEAGIRQQV